ncbi:hypothetical protein D3C86_671030 [compost metagenome]
MELDFELVDRAAVLAGFLQKINVPGELADVHLGGGPVLLAEGQEGFLEGDDLLLEADEEAILALVAGLVHLAVVEGPAAGLPLGMVGADDPVEAIALELLDQDALHGLPVEVARVEEALQAAVLHLLVEDVLARRRHLPLVLGFVEDVLGGPVRMGHDELVEGDRRPADHEADHDHGGHDPEERDPAGLERRDLGFPRKPTEGEQAREQHRHREGVEGHFRQA